MEGCPRVKTGEFSNTLFQFFDLGLELGCVFVGSSQLIFQPLEAAFFHLVVDVCLPYILALLDFVHVGFRELRHFQHIVEFARVNAQYALGGDPIVRHNLRNGGVVPRRAEGFARYRRNC